MRAETVAPHGVISISIIMQAAHWVNRWLDDLAVPSSLSTGGDNYVYAINIVSLCSGICSFWPLYKPDSYSFRPFILFPANLHYVQC